MPSLREAAVPLAGTVGSAVTIDVTAPGHTWVGGSTTATVRGEGGTVLATFGESIAGDTVTLTLTGFQTTSLGKGVYVWALQVGDVYWLGGRFTLDYPGEQLDLTDPNEEVTVATNGLTVNVAVANGGGGGGAGTGITAEDAVDAVAAALVGGANVTVTYSDVGNTITLAAATDAEVVRDTMASALVAGTGITVTPNDALNTITIATTGLDAEAVRDTVAATLVAGDNVTIVVNDALNTITINAATGSGGSVTTEQIEDAVAVLVDAGYGIATTYDDVAGSLLLEALTSTSATPPPHAEGREWYDPDAEPDLSAFGGGAGFPDPDPRLDALESTAASHNTRISILEGGGGGSGGFSILADLDPVASATANGNALRAAIVTARTTGANVTLPPGEFAVDDNCFYTPGDTPRMCFFGQPGRTILVLTGGAGNMHFYRDGGVGAYGHRFTIWDGIWFNGGDESATPPSNRHGFEFTGPFDQRWTWDRCYFHVLSHCIDLLGTDNASELNMVNTDVTHIAADGHYLKFANIQALNAFHYGGKIENVRGSIVRFDSTIVGGQERGGGGQIMIYGSSCIVIENGTAVSLNGNQSCVLVFDGCRFECRNGGSGLFKSNGNWLGNVTFSNGGSFTTSGAGVVNRLAHVRNTQSVTFRNWSFEDNGSRPDFLVDGGRLKFEDCAVYDAGFQSMVKWQPTPSGRAIARDCFHKYNPGGPAAAVNFSLLNNGTTTP